MEIKDVEALAELARMELTEEEKTAILTDMAGILAYVGQINALKVKADLEYKIKNVWREDKLKMREFSPALITKQFPDAQDGFLKVKKIL